MIGKDARNSSLASCMHQGSAELVSYTSLGAFCPISLTSPLPRSPQSAASKLTTQKWNGHSSPISSISSTCAISRRVSLTGRCSCHRFTGEHAPFPRKSPHSTRYPRFRVALCHEIREVGLCTCGQKYVANQPFYRGSQLMRDLSLFAPGKVACADAPG
jgi:hypothetical protein